MAYRPISSSNKYSQNWNEVNNMVRQLNKEATTKTFKQASGNAIIQGKLPYETDTGATPYGILIYDANGIPNILIGILPDGSNGIVVAKEGENVLDVFA